MDEERAARRGWRRVLLGGMATLALVLAVCYGIYYFVDYILNGAFMDWFSRNYVHQELYLDTAGNPYTINVVDWERVKLLLLFAFIAAVLCGVLAAFVSARVYAWVRVRRTIQSTSERIHRYMSREMDAGDAFPPAYAPVAAQMVQIKADMQRQEQTLRAEAQRRNDLIAYLAHDLKTPLTSVLGYLSLLDEADDLPEAQRRKYVRVALQKAVRLEQLINEFFEITRYNLHQIVLEKETVDLAYLLVQLTDEFYPSLAAHGNTARLEVPEELPLYGDPMKLARVFNNLLKNAIAYSYPDTEVLVSACTEGSEAVLRFVNRGRTIPAGKLDALFEKFFRLDEARTGNTGGAGLGLAIATEIVELHGGAIAAASADEVTTFTVRLPLGKD